MDGEFIKMKCEAVLSKDFMRVARDRHDGVCRRRVIFKIYGQNLCSIHAAMKSLKILNSRGELLEII